MKYCPAMPGLVISVAALKGGAGKTTLSTNLAAYLHAEGSRTLLLDADNASRAASKWGELAKMLAVDTAEVREVHSAHRNLEAAINAGTNTHDVVIVDGPANIDTAARTLISAADIVLLPCGPSPLDFFSLEETIAVYGNAIEAVEHPLPAAIVLTKLRNDRYRETISAREKAATYGIPVLSMRLRADYSAAYNEGQGATNYRPRGKAALEMQLLAEQILKTPKRKKGRAWRNLFETLQAVG